MLILFVYLDGDGVDLYSSVPHFVADLVRPKVLCTLGSRRRKQTREGGTRAQPNTQIFPVIPLPFLFAHFFPPIRFLKDDDEE